MYAADLEVFAAPQRQRLSSGANAVEPVLAVSDWVADRVDFFQATVGASTPLGDPSLRGGQAGISSLPSVGYTVAIQWGYYVFILLASGCVLVGILGDGYETKGRHTAIRRLDLVSRLTYPLVVIATVVGYVLRFR